MFSPTHLRHDEIVERLVALRKNITAQDVGNAFADSLVTRRLDLRSALGSFGAALNLPSHHFADSYGSLRCRTCWAFESSAAEDLNVLNFERFKWGGVRHSDPLYALLDLTRFRTSAPESSASEGHALLRRLLEIAGNAPANTRPNDLVKLLKSLIPGNASQRRVAIQCLGYAGVLQSREHAGFFDTYPIHRAHPPEGKNDWSYPISWWRGHDGVNVAAVRFYFPEVMA
ncbi:MAG TPA: hypothetical protein PLH31_15610 [Caulobacter sp.]|nr:hypothetical protein [Caulobacter sp.]